MNDTNDVNDITQDKDGCKETIVPVQLTIEEARQMAFETLRVIATMPGLEHIKDLVGRELDVSDELMDNAVTLLFKD